MRVQMSFLLGIGLILICNLAGAAQPLGLSLNLQPTQLIQLEVSMDRGKVGGTYAIGENARVFYNVTTAQAVSCAYVYLFNITSTGVVHQIFPNAFSFNNCVRTNVQHVVPDLSSYRLSVVSPMGQEIIQGIASFVPLNLSLVGGQFPVLGQTVDQARQRLLASIDQLNGTNVTTDLTSFQVVGNVVMPPVNQLPVACFNTTTSAAFPGQTVVFDAGCSFDPDFGDFIAQYQWDLNGDGFFESSGRMVSWTYSVPGGHSVQLRVMDKRGFTSTTFRTVLVTSFPMASPNFSVTFLDVHTMRLSVQGDFSWALARPFQLLVETDGFFNVASPQASGNAFHEGVRAMPAFGGGRQLNLRGQVGAGGRVDYFITFSSGSTRLLFDMRIDLNGDGFPEQVPTARILGPFSEPPFSNPFVVPVG